MNKKIDLPSQSEADFNIKSRIRKISPRLYSNYIESKATCKGLHLDLFNENSIFLLFKKLLKIISSTSFSIILKKFLAKIRKESIDEIFKKNKEAPDKIFEPEEDTLWNNMNKENFKIHGDNPLENNPFHYTERVYFELSNLCNYSIFHKKCPLNHQKEVKILPLSVIKGVIDCLSKYQFAREFAFHNYNEPLIDPRLFYLIKYAKEKCPKSYVYICTNGFYFNQTIGEELASFGVSKIHISIYSRKELERLRKIHLSIPIQLEVIKLDETLNIYSCHKLNLKKECSAPLREIIITREAKVSLCCYDWAYIYTFGNLERKSLDEIIRDGLMYEVYKRLSRGERFLNICKNCQWTR